jgi:acyl-CoA dehydrogenase
LSAEGLLAKAGVSGSAARRPIPPFTPEHEEFRQVVRRFVVTELYPHAAEWEEARWFPNELFGVLASHGYLGLKFPVQYGGDDDPVADAVLVEEMARCGSGGLAAGLGAHSGIALPPIWKFGTEEQKQRYLVPGLRGEKIAALAITEPDAGSDVASLRTSARKVDGGYLVNGAKTFITGGVRADVLVTAVKTSAEGGHHGLSFLLIDRGPGVSSSPLQKLGWHASDTALITFDDVFVPDENLLGEENRGFYLIMANFQWERLLMALGSVGAMQAAFERTVHAVLERDRRNGGSVHGQAVRHHLAEVAVMVQAGRDLTYHALRLFAEGHDAVREVTMAKLATQRPSFDVMDTCLQILGWEGYASEGARASEDAQASEDTESAFDIARAARDARLGPIGGGTDEIMREILGRSLGL